MRKKGGENEIIAEHRKGIDIGKDKCVACIKRMIRPLR
jgi:hypothetical protein